MLFCLSCQHPVGREKCLFPVCVPQMSCLFYRPDMHMIAGGLLFASMMDSYVANSNTAYNLHVTFFTSLVVQRSHELRN